MRYSIMLQVVGIITLIFVGTAGLFAWLQNREIPSELDSKRSPEYYSRTQSNE
ncbi:hypothetical protein [Myxosarcina sp. GI1]|uniref:hypothetical protein n=1 Tax=Myxosarcina sp. GI1 TaxID=1541065 RepID=UPI00155A87EB|nr:hypothetical protein [Myxosarcina sp. GI1]